MSALDDLLAGYRRFRANRWPEQRAAYHAVKDSQSPGVMIIGCADSRVDPATIFDAGPGEIFVVRNVANLVPPYEKGGGRHGVSAALEFAVKALRVKHIVVMGHGGCGGISACVHAAQGNPIGEFIAPWVEIAAPARKSVIGKMPAKATHEELCSALEMEAIGTSIENLKSFDFVRDALEKDQLDLHGAWFAVASGELHWRSESGQFRLVDEAERALD